jgi:ATP-dependent protease ClpP protease subunit
MIWAIDTVKWWLEDNPVILHCSGIGGNGEVALGIIDYMQNVGNIHGYLYGEAASANAFIWLGCQERYFSKRSTLSLHSSYRHVHRDAEWHAYDERKIKAKLESNRGLNDRLYGLLAEVSGLPVDYWRDKLDGLGQECYELGADELLTLGMGKLIS